MKFEEDFVDEEDDEEVTDEDELDDDEVNYNLSFDEGEHGMPPKKKAAKSKAKS